MEETEREEGQQGQEQGRVARPAARGLDASLLLPTLLQLAVLAVLTPAELLPSGGWARRLLLAAVLALALALAQGGVAWRRARRTAAAASGTDDLASDNSDAPAAAAGQSEAALAAAPLAQQAQPSMQRKELRQRPLAGLRDTATL